MRYIHFILFVFLISPIYSQQKEDTSITIINRLWQDTKSFFSAPTNYNSNEWMTVGGVVAGTAMVSLLDNPIKDFSRNSKSRSAFTDKILRIDDYYGTTTSALYIVGATYLTGEIFSSPKIRNAAILIGESALYSSIITQFIKRLLGRERPEYTDNRYHFTGPNLSNDKFQSLPSGHATCVFSISTVAAELTDSYWLKVLFYTPAFLTSYARIYHNRHWLSDVVFGGMIGYITGKFVTKNRSEKQSISYKLKFEQDLVSLSFTVGL